jgi:glycosyltransferase involved in cell wall biosynthesis
MKLIAHNDGSELRGNERQLLLIATGLRDRAHEVAVSCRSEAPLKAELEKRSIRTTPLRPRGDFDFLAAWAFRGWLRAEQPNAVLLTSWKRVLTAAWAAHRAGVRRIVVRLGIVRTAPQSGRVVWRLRQAFENYVDALVVNSNDVAEAWLASAPWFPREKLHLILNAVQPVPSDCQAVRRELGLEKDDKVIAAVGALEQRKGFDLTLRALEQMPEHVHLIVAGDGPEASALAQLATSLGVSKRTHWLGFRNDVPNVLAAGDAFVLPSRQDSLANSLLEAMATGSPRGRDGRYRSRGCAGGESRPAARRLDRCTRRPRRAGPGAGRSTAGRSG